MVVYLMEIPDLEYPFFSRLTKFQQCMFAGIHWILISPDCPIKIPYNRCLYVEVHCALIEYENGKAKPAHYLVQLVDLVNPRYRQQEWFPEWHELLTDPALSRAIDFFNIYHEMWALIEQRCNDNALQNTTFTYHNEFSKYIKIQGEPQKMSLIIYLMLELESSYQKKKRNISMNYLKNGTQRIFN